MTTGAERARQQWLDKVRAHAEVTDRHYAAAEVLAHTTEAPDEHRAAADDLVRIGFLSKNPDGTYAALDQWAR
jgi:hypothetical protein